MTPSAALPLTSSARVGEKKPFLVTVVCFAAAALHGLQGGLPRRCATRNDGVCLAMKAFRHATAHELWLPTCRVAFQMCRVCGGVSFAGVARSYGGACCLCEAVRPWQSMPVTPRNLCNSAWFAGWIAASLCSSQ